MKTCSKCEEVKPLDQFFARKSAADGRMSSCKACKTKATYAWRDRNREKWNDYVAAQYRSSERRRLKIENNAAIAAEKKAAFEGNKSAILAERGARNEKRDQVKAYRKTFRSTPEYRERASARRSEKQSNDAGYRLSRRMSSGIARTLKSGKGGKSWQSLVPYTLDRLHRHIELQFLPGMTWENMGDWHIDHIMPLSSFSFERECDEGFHAAWAITNLRPLWGTDNLVKSSKILTLL